MKKIFLLTLFVCGFVLCAYPAISRPVMVGKEFYTRVNIWYEDSIIPSTNYHLGQLMNVGTKVKITEVCEDISYPGIRFQVEGKKFYIRIRKSLTKGTVKAIFDRYFSATDPLAEGGEFLKFTAREQECIKKGIIEKGMSKEAVVMAYGYPPSHKTPTLDGDLWTYWKTIHRTETVSFDGNVVMDFNSATSNKTI